MSNITESDRVFCYRLAVATILLGMMCAIFIPLVTFDWWGVVMFLLSLMMVALGNNLLEASQ